MKKKHKIGRKPLNRKLIEKNRKKNLISARSYLQGEIEYAGENTVLTRYLLQLLAITKFKRSNTPQAEAFKAYWNEMKSLLPKVNKTGINRNTKYYLKGKKVVIT